MGRSMMFDMLRRRQEQMAAAVHGLDDAQRSELTLLHERWKPGGLYEPDEVVQFREELYRCLQPHIAQEDWTPDAAPSLWVRIMYRDGIRIIPEVITATEAFALGEFGWWGDALYQSLIDGNVYTPDAYPAGWELAADALPQDEPEPEPELETEPELEAPESEASAIPEWEQPVGSDGYVYGVAVMHNGVKWVNTLYGMPNVFEPGVYGWEVVPDD